MERTTEADPDLYFIPGRQRQRAAKGARPAGRLCADWRRLVWPGQGLRQGPPDRLLQDLALLGLCRRTHGSENGLNDYYRIVRFMRAKIDHLCLVVRKII